MSNPPNAHPSSSTSNTPRYTFGHPSTVTSAHAQRLATTDASHLLPHLEPQFHLLDVGCGPGSITVDFVKGGWIDSRKGGRVVGIEPPSASENGSVLEQARKYAREVLGVEDEEQAGIRFEQGDVFDLKQFKEESFDVVHVSQVLFHLSEPVKALREIIRVTKRGGIVSLREADWDTVAISPTDPRMLQCHKMLRDIYTSNGASVQAGRHLHSWLRQAAASSTSTSTSTNANANASSSSSSSSSSSAGAAGIARAHLSLGNFLYTNANSDGTASMWATSMRGRLQIIKESGEAVRKGFIESEEEVERMREAWEVWGRDDDAFFAITHGQLVAWKA